MQNLGQRWVSPPDNREREDDLCQELLARSLTAVRASVEDPAEGRAVGPVGRDGRREETDRDQAPHPTEAVDRDGLRGVVKPAAQTGQQLPNVVSRAVYVIYG